MANSTILRGACPAPFLQLSNFQSTDGCECLLGTNALDLVLIRDSSTWPILRSCSVRPRYYKLLSALSNDRLGLLGQWVVWQCYAWDEAHVLSGFKSVPKIISWVNVAGLVCAMSLLVSYFVLPTEKTSRHYLTIGMIVSVCFLEVPWIWWYEHWINRWLPQLGFIIPLGAQPEQCHDAITPNDMYSDLACAFSGASLILGGLAVIMWGRSED